jgi:hypothetical protein
MTISLLNPDRLLVAFASALARRPLSPFHVKRILEASNFHEKGKARIQDFEEPLRRALIYMVSGLEAAHHMPKGSALRTEQILQGRSMSEIWPAFQELVGTLEPTYWKMVLSGKANIDTSMDHPLKRNIIHLHAAERLLALTYPDLDVSSIQDARTRHHELLPKPSHRPSSGKPGERFRTAAVGAVMLYRLTGLRPQDSWKRVADHLIRAKVPRPGMQRFAPTTIKNWSSKGMYDENLCDGMISLAKSSPRTPAEAAKYAVEVAVIFGKQENY